MNYPTGGRPTPCALARKLSIAFSAVVLSAALTACGGGGADSPAAAAPSPVVIPSPGGGTVADSGGGNLSAGDSGASTGGSASTGGGTSTGDDSPAPGANDAPAGGGDVTVAAVPGTTTLSWTPPTTNEDGTPLVLTGYRIYWGQQKGYYTSSVTVQNPGLTRYVIEQLEPATWYFVATALSDRGESEFSNEIAMRIL